MASMPIQPQGAVRPVRLSEIARIFNGKTPAKAEQRDRGHPVLKIKDIDEDGEFRGHYGSYVDEELARKYAEKKACTNDIMILNAAHNADYVASKKFIARDNVAGALATGEWLIIRCDSSHVVPAYIYYWLGHEQTKRMIKFIVKGIHLYPKDVAALEVPLPPLAEQRRIVDILDRAAAIQRLRKAAEEKAREIIPALFVDMFGDPATNPKGWPTKRLDEVAQVDRGKSRHRPRDEKKLYGGEYPFIQTSEVANSGGIITAYAATYSEFGLAQSKLWPIGTLCVTIAANIAKTGILQFAACFPDSVVGITRGRDTNNEYLQAWVAFLQPTLEAQAPQLAQKNINLEILRTLSVPMPPKAFQDRFADMCQRVRATQALKRDGDALATSVGAAINFRLFSAG